MQKFVNLCKKPILIISCVMFIASFLVFVLLNNSEHGTKYEYKYNVVSIELKDVIVLKNDKAIIQSYITMGEKTVSNLIEFDYEIIDRKLYYFYNYSQKQLIGDINAFRIKIDKTYFSQVIDYYLDNVDYDTYSRFGSYSEFKNYVLQVIGDVTYKNNAAILTNNIAIVCMITFGVLILGCIVVIIVNKIQLNKPINNQYNYGGRNLNNGYMNNYNPNYYQQNPNNYQQNSNYYQQNPYYNNPMNSNIPYNNQTMPYNQPNMQNNNAPYNNFGYINNNQQTYGNQQINNGVLDNHNQPNNINHNNQQ